MFIFIVINLKKTQHSFILLMPQIVSSIQILFAKEGRKKESQERREEKRRKETLKTRFSKTSSPPITRKSQFLYLKWLAIPSLIYLTTISWLRHWVGPLLPQIQMLDEVHFSSRMKWKHGKDGCHVLDNLWDRIIHPKMVIFAPFSP